MCDTSSQTNPRFSGSLYVISGPSGVGKGTLIWRVTQKLSYTWVSVSATTRRPRHGEVDGIHYFFLSREEFKDMIEKGGFVEWARVHNHYYGTPVAPIYEHLRTGWRVILELDVQGALSVKKVFPEAHLIFIAPPSPEELERRLRRRGSETDEMIANRLITATREMRRAKDYEITIVNDDLDEASTRLLSVLQC